MSGKLHTSCILYIAKRHPFGCPKCLWLKPYPPNLFLARERICDYASAALRHLVQKLRYPFPLNPTAISSSNSSIASSAGSDSR